MMSTEGHLSLQRPIKARKCAATEETARTDEALFFFNPERVSDRDRD